MVTHVPIRSFAKSHNLPHHNPKAPNITGRSELSVCYCLWSRPANGDFTSLFDTNDSKYVTLSYIQKTNTKLHFALRW